MVGKIPLLLIYILSSFVFILASDSHAEINLRINTERDIRVVKDDFRTLYLDADNIINFLGVGALSGLFANTDIDREFQEFYRDDIKSRWTNGASKVFRVPGELYITLPVVLGLHLVLDEGTPAGEWADKSLRALIVGGPAGLFVQRLTGAGRPNEGGSQWRPFVDNNGLSGHAFVGAVPLLTAARMQSDPYLKALLYTLSTLPAASRVNDDRHYLSQALLGWYLAYLSVAAVDAQKPADGVSFFVVPAANDGILLGASLRY